MMEKLAGDFERLELNGSTVIPIHIGSHIHILKRAQTHLSLSRDVSVFTGPALRTSFFSLHLSPSSSGCSASCFCSVLNEHSESLLY